MVVTSLKDGELRTGRTELEAQTRDGNLIYVLPLVGPGTYNTVMSYISEQRLQRPTTAQSLSLVDLALKNKDEPHCKDLLSTFRSRYFWSATENLWTPEGVIVYDNIDGKMPSDKKALMKRFKDGDKSVRFVDYGFETREQDVSTLVRNPYIIAQVGGDKDFAEDVVARVAKGVSRNKPYVWAMDKPSRDVKRYTALYSYWNGGRLDIFGIFDVDDVNGFASGILTKKEN